MPKTLAHILFGIGKVPESHARELEDEGIVVRDEGVGASFSCRHARGPGRVYLGKWKTFTGSLVLTERTFAAFWWSRSILRVALDDPRLAALACSVTRAGGLRFRFETGVFREGWTGVVTFKYRTAHGETIADHLRASGASSLER